MSKLKKAVIVVHRDESTKDFKEVARRVRKIDPSIGVAMVSEILTSKMVPPEFLNLPLLVVYLCNPPPTEFKVATKLAVKEMSKIEEYELFKKHGLPCLPIEHFKWGMSLDRKVYGDWVVLKPVHTQSTGKHVNMLPIDEISNLKIDNFPKDHYIHHDEYYVQKLLKTGARPFHYRAMIFLGKILYSATNESFICYPSPTADIGTLLSTSIASNNPGNRKRRIVIDQRKNEFALKVSKAFANYPILGIDIIEDSETKKLYVLEVNEGGNGWHFSSEIAANLPDHNEAQLSQMLRQYHAFDSAAEAIVEKTHELAS